jgi:hypothetical protein
MQYCSSLNLAICFKKSVMTLISALSVFTFWWSRFGSETQPCCNFFVTKSVKDYSKNPKERSYLVPSLALNPQPSWFSRTCLALGALLFGSVTPAPKVSSLQDKKNLWKSIVLGGLKMKQDYRVFHTKWGWVSILKKIFSLYLRYLWISHLLVSFQGSGLPTF